MSKEEEKLETRIVDFAMLQLPGQPQMMHTGTANLVDDLWSEVKRLRDTLRLPLLFHRGGPWTVETQKEWARITGTMDCTTKVMCDAIRSVLP